MKWDVSFVSVFSLPSLLLCPICIMYSSIHVELIDLFCVLWGMKVKYEK